MEQSKSIISLGIREHNSLRAISFFKVFLDLLFIILFLFLPVKLLAQKEGPVSKIENPHEYFGDERMEWVGKTIFFLRCDHVKIKNPYFDWYYDPYKLERTKAKRDDLLYKYGKIEEVWHGQIWLSKPQQRPYWRLGFFWKVRLLHNQKEVYYWDDNESKVFNFGFVEDYKQAQDEIGRTVWSKKRKILYQFDDLGTIPLGNLQPIKLDSVAWGEYGNFPIKFILSTKSKQRGYLLYKNYKEFVKDWYQNDPRGRFPHWRMRDWKLIEDRQLRVGMIEDMVLLSWGDPTKTSRQGNKDGTQTQIWTYEGVKERTYFLHFRDGKLRRVRWTD